MTRLRQGYGGQVHRPPRLATWLIAREIDDRRGEDLLGDLEELFQGKALDHGPARANDAGSQKFLGADVSGGAQGTPREVSEAPVA